MRRGLPTNFVVIYSSREGSSAIIETLSTFDDISVPVFEEFDEYWVRKFYGDKDNISEMSRMLKNDAFDLGHDYARRAIPSIGAAKPNARCVGFKWRPFGDLDRTLDMFKENNVKVFLLFRRDVLEQCCSHFVTRYTRAEDGRRLGHVQFQLRRAEGEAREEIARSIEGLRVRLNPATFYAMMVRRIWKAVKSVRLGARARRRGIPVTRIYYEDFLRDPEAFVAAMRRELGLPPVSLAPAEGGGFVKAFRRSARDNIRGVGFVLYNPLTWALTGAQRLIVGATPGDFGAANSSD